MNGIKFRLIVMNFLQFAVWGAYLTCMGTYLHYHGLASHIGIFYSIQGIVSIFMPALMGIIADRWIPAQKTLGLCHLISGAAMISAAYYGLTMGDAVQFGPLFTLYSIGVAFYMPTLAISNSVAYNALDKAGLDTVKAFPPIRVFGTIGFICTMWIVDLLGFQATAAQFAVSGGIGIVLGLYSFTLPACPINKADNTSFVDKLGLRAFALFKDKRMAYFFIFSMLLGVSLQITNGFANPYITSFGHIEKYAGTFGVQHANILISLSQISETLCILLIPFFLRRYGIKKVMLIAMFAWVLRFAFFGLGNPGGGVWLFILSCIVYGVAFDFFNISGSLFVDKETDQGIRSSAQGLFFLMTNGIGATIGTLGAQAIVNYFVNKPHAAGATPEMVAAGWQNAWFVFAAYALVVAVVFAIVFKYNYNPEDKK
ncbi:MAG: MFS transporter [Bacteroidales bacterium]|jgi:NHS family xanthosine MFS transporter|nr:MFS transporter [Bacteroidales bacterium]